MRWLSYRIFILLGWRFIGEVPEIPKMVIVGAPHTSNWDFFIFLAALYRYRMKVNYLAKHTLFRWPFGPMFRKVGGIPVDRHKSGGIVNQVKAAFDESVKMILVIAPEGTRKAAKAWKSGFVEIAKGTDVPVVFAGVNSADKTLTISPPVEVGDDVRVFMDTVRDFYADMNGIHPEGKGPVRLKHEPVAS